MIRADSAPGDEQGPRFLRRYSDYRYRASSACNSQVLVLEDMLGLSRRTPKFVRHYGNLGPMI